jgi:hypothetical protein
MIEKRIPGRMDEIWAAIWSIMNNEQYEIVVGKGKRGF